MMAAANRNHNYNRDGGHREPVCFKNDYAILSSPLWLFFLALCGCFSLLYATLRTMSAEFFDPKAMQLQMACSMFAARPASGT